ncbi:polysaccharide deacetylase [Deltaproteobacteria bacterium]|nr:polysaccharide deacetylase [Deltaproteobacteria bacterium]
MRSYLCAVILTLLFILAFTGGSLAGSVPALREEPEESVADLAGDLTEKYRGRHPVLWGERLPGIVASLPQQAAPETGERVMALTLDACDGGTDKRIIALLRQYAVPAAIFVTNRWLRNNLSIAKELASDSLFTLGCHGARHKPASIAGKSAYGIRGNTNIAALVAEVERNARALASVTGKRPRWYRSGTAHYDEVALAVIHDCGFWVAGYTVSIDAGASLAAGEVEARLKKAPPNAIILCHINHPESGTFGGLAAAIPAMLAAGVRFVPLHF